MFRRLKQDMNERTDEYNEQEEEGRPLVHYDTVCTERDQFPDLSLLHPIDSVQNQEISAATAEKKYATRMNGLTDEKAQEIDTMVDDHVTIFRTSFLYDPPAKFAPLVIETKTNAKPVKVRIRNYSQEQKEFLITFVQDLMRHDMAYPNPTASWASAPLLVPKPILARFRFTVDLRPTNACMVRHKYQMPNLEKELTKLGTANCFATFFLSHGCCTAW